MQQLFLQNEAPRTIFNERASQRQNNKIEIEHMVKDELIVEEIRLIQKFIQQNFDKKFVNEMSIGQYDIVLLTNLDALLARGKNLSWLQDIVEILTKKVPIVLIEIKNK